MHIYHPDMNFFEAQLRITFENAYKRLSLHEMKKKGEKRVIKIE